MSDQYTKGEGELSPRVIHTPINTAKADKSAFTQSNLSEEYQKTDGKLDPSLFVIVSGGEEREKDYFMFFQNKTTHFPRIEIEFISEDATGITGLDVNNLVKRALEIKKLKEESKGDDILDSINLVTDVDHFYSQIKNNISICEEENLNLVISNPCFEVWLYYTYFSDKPDYNLPDNPLKISSGFKTYLGEKVKGGVNPHKDALEIEKAIKHSENNYEEDEHQIPKLFSTQMHLLASKLFDLSREEIIEYKKIAEERKLKYLNKGK